MTCSITNKHKHRPLIRQYSLTLGTIQNTAVSKCSDTVYAQAIKQYPVANSMVHQMLTRWQAGTAQQALLYSLLAAQLSTRA
jgi:hypothetical protein